MESFRRNQLMTRVEDFKSPSKDDVLWMEQVDPDTAEVFWFNEVTGEIKYAETHEHTREDSPRARARKKWESRRARQHEMFQRGPEIAPEDMYNPRNECHGKSIMALVPSLDSLLGADMPPRITGPVAPESETAATQPPPPAGPPPPASIDDSMLMSYQNEPPPPPGPPTDVRLVATPGNGRVIRGGARQTAIVELNGRTGPQELDGPPQPQQQQFASWEEECMFLRKQNAELMEEAAQMKAIIGKLVGVDADMY